MRFMIDSLNNKTKTVEWKTISDIIVSLKTGLNPRQNFSLNENGSIFPYITGKDIYDNNINVTEKTDKITQPALELINKRAKLESGLLLFASTGTGTVGRMAVIQEYNDDWGISETLYAIKVNSEIILPNYLMHFLYSSVAKSQFEPKVSKGSVPHLKVKDLLNVKVPIPSLEVQAEIVKLLDVFSESVGSLQQELEKEFTARKKQYEYYRDLLLDFGAHEKATSECEWRTLSDVIISLNTGLNPRNFFQLNTDDAENYYITIREIKNGKIIPTETTDKINDEALYLCNKRSNLEAGDVLFSGTGTIGETAVITEKPINWNIKEGVYTIKPIQSRISPFYLRYILQTEKIKIAYMKKVSGGTVKSIPMGEMKKLMIPVPPIEEQERIISILDRFDKLCNDISEGLPAEIEARHKQYEYYRDKLLTFNVKK